MSATITLVQHDAVHLLVDGLGYRADRTIVEIRQKAYSFPVARMAVTSTGPAAIGLLAGHALEAAFGSFDAIVEGAAEFLPGWYSDQDFSAHARHAVTGHVGEATLTLVGWSAERRRPEAYFMLMCPPEAADIWKAEGSPPFQLRPEEHFCATPFPSMSEIIAADFRPLLDAARDRDLAGMAERMDPESDLLWFLEIQRRHRDDYGPSAVGGLALLTTVTEAGISQRVIRRWEEDQLGSKVSPQPIDWSRQGVRPATATPAALASGLPSPGLNRRARRAARACR